MTSHSVPSIISDIIATGKQYKSNEPGSREALLDLGRALTMAVEIPSEFIQRSMWAEPAVSGINRMAVELKIFQHLRDAGAKGLTIPELAAETGADASLLGRMMRHLAAMRLVDLISSSDSGGDGSDDARLRGTPLTDGLAEDRFQDSIAFCYDVSRPAFNTWPSFFAAREYRADALGPVDGPFQHAHRKPGDPEHFFPWLEANPPNLVRFASFMSAYRAGHPNWWDFEAFYPLRERLVAGFDPDGAGDVFLVDVGGGRGHDLDQLLAVHRDLPGRVVLQDQASVIATIEDKEAKAFEPMAHDFFTPQPMRHARAYHLHSILHDWDDKDSLRILENLKPALKPGYSRVLFYEIVVSEENPTLAATCMDVQMLAHLGVQERTEAHWRRLLGEAGYEVTKIYTYPGVAESVMEAQLAMHPN